MTRKSNCVAASVGTVVAQRHLLKRLRRSKPQVAIGTFASALSNDPHDSRNPADAQLRINHRLLAVAVGMALHNHVGGWFEGQQIAVPTRWGDAGRWSIRVVIRTTRFDGNLCVGEKAAAIGPDAIGAFEDQRYFMILGGLSADKLFGHWTWPQWSGRRWRCIRQADSPFCRMSPNQCSIRAVVLAVLVPDRGPLYGAPAAPAYIESSTGSPA